jgi:hypothetical protein
MASGSALLLGQIGKWGGAMAAWLEVNDKKKQQGGVRVVCLFSNNDRNQSYSLLYK